MNSELTTINKLTTFVFRRPSYKYPAEGRQPYACYQTYSMHEIDIHNNIVACIFMQSEIDYMQSTRTANIIAVRLAPELSVRLDVEIEAQISLFSC